MEFVNYSKIGAMLLLAFLSRAVYLIIFRLCFHPCRHIPGPLLARLSYAYQSYYDIVLGGCMSENILRLHDIYGPIVRIAPDRIHVNDSKFYFKIHGPKELFLKPDYLYGNLGFGESMICIQDPKLYRLRRNEVNPFFTPQATRQHETLVFEEVEKLVARLKQPFNTTKRVNISREIGQVLSTISCKIFYGAPPHEILEEDAFAIFDGVNSWLRMMPILVYLPIIRKIAMRVLPSLGSTVSPFYCLLRKKFQSWIEHRQYPVKQNNSDAKSPSILFDLINAGKPKNVPLLAAEAMGYFTVSVHTTNTAIAHMLGYILSHPSAHERLRNELNMLTNNGDRTFSYDDLRNSEYLTAVLKESLRMRPVLPGFIPRIVPPSGVDCVGVSIPSGAIVATSQLSVFRNEAIFEEAHKFKPERWMDPESKNLDDWFIAFSRGPRNCPGRHLVMLMMRVVVASLIANFDIIPNPCVGVDLTAYWDRYSSMLKRPLEVNLVPVSLKQLPEDGTDLMETRKEISNSRQSTENNSLTKSSGIRELTNTVFLPDLFVSWASMPMKINSNLETAGKEAGKWFKEVFPRDEQKVNKYLACKFQYLIALWLPEAPEEDYRTLCDFNNWLFVFDDPIDEGILQNKQELVTAYCDEAFSVLSEESMQCDREKAPLLYILHQIWQRVVKKSGLGVQRRLRQSIRDFFKDVIHQADPSSLDKPTDLEDFLAGHKYSAGVRCIVHMMEHCNALDLPDCVLEDKAVQRIQDLATELVQLSNDIYSHVKEIKSGDKHNAIYFLRTKKNMNQQEAYDFAASAVYARYEEWDSVVAQIPKWGSKIDSKVERFIELNKLCFLGTLNWSFVSERYFGKENHIVKETRRVPAVPV